jgi:hypothetical protein
VAEEEVKMDQGASDVPVNDPFGVRIDPKMPFLAQALEPIEAQRRLNECWGDRQGNTGQVKLHGIQVRRYKAGRRCLIEYDVEVQGERRIWVGKARAKGADKTTCQLLETLWSAGFDARSDDGFSVPKPIGPVREFGMWLQAKAPGEAAWQLLLRADGPALARRIAEGIHKLHQANILAFRAHTMADELRILHERLAQVAQLRPDWNARLERVVAGCERLGSSLPELPSCGIHRDFYPAHVLVDGERIWLLDFDLYCQGDPPLDVGNFLGHVTEQSLRQFNNPAALADREQALEDRFVELAGEATRRSVRAYATLTLARHIYLSTRFLERQPFTEPVLELCEQRLGL